MPRNSREPTPARQWELAVRNQFSTPSYMVEFLTANTLGCITFLNNISVLEKRSRLVTLERAA
jgi:hypothetical protein